jgi:hypothetical protein
LSCLLNTASHTINAGIYTLMWGHNMRTGSLTRPVLSCLSDRAQTGIKYSLKSVHVNLPFPIRTPSNSLVHFLSNSPPLYSCYVPQEREQRDREDVSGVAIATCPSVSQCGINIATATESCSFQPRCRHSCFLLRLFICSALQARYEVRSCVQTSLEARLCSFMLSCA